MSKLLLFALLFACSIGVSALPATASATVGAGCNTASDCSALAGEACDTQFPQGSKAGTCVRGTSTGTGQAPGGGGGGGVLNTSRLAGFANDIKFFINDILVPLLTAVAFIVFLWGVYNYFIKGGDSDKNHEEGKQFVLYGVIGFVIIFSLWGLVNVGVELLNVGVGPRSDSTLPYPKL